MFLHDYPLACEIYTGRTLALTPAQIKHRQSQDKFITSENMFIC